MRARWQLWHAVCLLPLAACASAIPQGRHGVSKVEIEGAEEMNKGEKSFFHFPKVDIR
jgi:hypothetical protein